MIILENYWNNKEKINMKNLKIFNHLFNLIIFISSCGTIKEGFKNQKKNNSR